MIGRRHALYSLRGEKGETTMRRLVGISARNAVAVALPLAGALYLAAEARQAMVRRYSDALNALTAGSQQSSISQPEDPRQSGTGRIIGSSTASRDGSDHRAIGSADDPHNGAKTLASTAVPATPDAQSPKFSQRDEVAAEQQAAKLPAQKPTKQSAKDSHTRQIIISIPDRRLALLEDGQLVKVYPVAVGRLETPSPDGEFTIINHAVDPTYRHEGKEVAPGKDNPLGTRWMGLSAKGYGIHGTNVQSSVGKVASHGCFRMKKKDVEELYRRVQVGDAVSVRGERDELTASLFSSGDQNANPAVVASKGEMQTASAVPMTAIAVATNEDQ
jgi:lipoprotein-anchoring transpeptidase ErfK/SrfK